MSLPEQKTQAGFPPCIHLSIEFNQHAVYYQSVEQWLENQESLGGIDWISPEEKQKAIETNSVWVCQWYPATPIGFNALAASSFDVLMKGVNHGTT